MLFADTQISDSVQIVTAICGVITALGVPAIGAVGGYIAYKMYLLKKGQEEASDQAEKDQMKAAHDREETKKRDEAAAAATKAVKDRLDEERSRSVKNETIRNLKMDEVAKKADIVAEKLDTHTTTTEKKLDSISMAMNGPLTKALETVSALTSKEADRTGLPADIAAAGKAANSLDHHLQNVAEMIKPEAADKGAETGSP